MMIPTLRRLSQFALFLVFLMTCEANTSQEQSHASVDSIPDRIPVQPPPPPPPPPTIPLEYIMGKFEPSKDSNFVKIASAYTYKSNIYLHKEAYKAFLAMHAAAQLDSVSLRIISATRSFRDQRSIWEAKWNGATRLSDGTNASSISDFDQRALRILEYSSMPGSSRHHWGTDIDLNNLNNPYFEKGKGKKEYDWLVANAARFGFCQPYTPKGADRPDGYNEEKWHWSYLPLAKQYQASARQLLKNEDIQGFAGAEVAPNIDVVKKYVFGINPNCL